MLSNEKDLQEKQLKFEQNMKQKEQEKISILNSLEQQI